MRPGRAGADDGVAREQHPPAGATAKVDLALSGLPAFHEDEERLRGRIVIGPSIDVERASDARRYGLAEEPWIEATIPSLVDPSLAPEGRHVMSAIVQSARASCGTGTGGASGNASATSR